MLSVGVVQPLLSTRYPLADLVVCLLVDRLLLVVCPLPAPAVFFHDAHHLMGLIVDETQRVVESQWLGYDDDRVKQAGL